MSSPPSPPASTSSKSPARCPDDDALLALVDEPDPAGPVSLHVACCAACTEKTQRMEELFADLKAPLAAFPVDSFVERLRASTAEERPAPASPTPVRPRWMRAAAMGGAALAIAAMIALVPRLAARPDGGTFTSRGPAAEASPRRDVDVGLDVVSRSPARSTLTPASVEQAVTPGVHLLVSYATRSARADAHLLAFAVDASDEVHWLYPAFEDAASDPASVVLLPGMATTAMATEAVLDDVPPGPLQIYALVSSHPLHVSDVERIPPGERWAGSPSRPDPVAGPVFEEMAAGEAPRTWSRRLLAGFCLGLVALEMLPFIAIIPVMLLVWWVLLSWGLMPGLAVTALAGPVFVLMVCLTIVSAQALIPGKTPTGIHVLRSRLGLRKWFLDKLFEASLLLTNSLYATLYTVPWLRLLGAKIGARCEVSTVAHIDPELLVLAPQSFVADMAQVGSAKYHNGFIAQDKTEIGRRAFVGNAAFIPAGTTLGDDSLVGVHTVPPTEGVPAGSSWLGSPAIYLPRRQESQAFDAELTFSPGRARVLERYGFEFLRIAVPGSLIAAGVFIALLLISIVASTSSAWVVVVTAPAAFLGMGLAMVVLVAGLKWLLVGAYVPRVEPLWGRFVRRSELVTGLYEAAAVPALLQSLTGTPLLGPLLRLFGTKVGRRTLIESTYLTEFDLVHIGDDAIIGASASLQTHLFEDRVMKMSVVSIESGASVGTRSVVLYDAVLGHDSTLGPLSLVMKGESLMPDTRWAGIPAEFAQD